MKRILFVAVCVFSLEASTAFAQSKEWKKELENSVKGLYPQTKTARFDQSNVTEAGIILVVMKPNLMGEPVKNITSSVNKVVNGELKAPGGASAFFQSSKNRMFKVGDKVYMTDFSVDDDAFTVRLLSTEVYDVVDEGTTKPQRVRSFIRFEIPKPQLSTMTVAQVKQLIDPIFALEADAATSATKTISIGQTIADVEKNFGKPATVINLGNKVTYSYKDMKVIFVDGKVADVQ